MTATGPFDIVMYHYVRNSSASRFPGIKGLSVAEFEFQLDYLLDTYTVLEPQDVHDIVESNAEFPPKSCWLTFDDGYVDHFQTVFPLLEARGLKGSFFPPVLTTMRRDVLDVNKIHFVLAAGPSPDEILRKVETLFNDQDAVQATGRTFAEHVSDIDTSSRFDSADVIIIKRLLQRELPETIRAPLCAELFRTYVTDDVADFANDLYMSVAELKQMSDAGHEVGIHGFTHSWLGSLSAEEQRVDIHAAVDFYRTEHLLPTHWTMCYPYGSYNSDTLKIIANAGCSIGITTVPESVSRPRKNPLELPRLDTNDFPRG